MGHYFDDSKYTSCPHCERSPGEAGVTSGSTPKVTGSREPENKKKLMLLSPGMILNDRYTIRSVLSAGEFGVTYMVKDNATGAQLVAKEYLPMAFAVRDGNSKQVFPSSSENAGIYDHGLKVFAQEAKSLGMFLGNPSIVQVTDNFNQYGTSYYVMELLDGVNIKTYVNDIGGKLPVTLALDVLQSVCLTLMEIHEKGFKHRDINPESIFITKQGMIKLIDFGETRLFIGERSRSLTDVLRPGFSPPEQYSYKGNTGPWTDIYALGATILSLVSGESIPTAPDLLSGASLVSILTSAGLEPELSSVLKKSMAPDYRERYQTAGDFLAAATGLNFSSSSGEDGMPGSSLSMPVKSEGSPYVQLIQGDKWLIPENTDITIGRAKNKCYIALADKGVSRVHCVIRFDSSKQVFILTDRSSGGTYLKNGRMKQNVPHTLLPGEKFILAKGKSELEVGVK